MGYSTSIRTLEAILPYLLEVAAATHKEWILDSPKAAQLWAYKVREGFSLVKANPELAHTLVGFAASHEVKVIGATVVLELKAAPTEVRPRLKVPSMKEMLGASEPQLELVIPPPATVRPGDLYYRNARPLLRQSQTTVESIIEICEGNAEGEPRIHFAKANLSPTDLIRLFEWTTVQRPSWIMFVVDGDITLRQYNEEFDGLYWTPEDL